VKTTSSDINSPTFSKRVIETAMTIANGRTMILGGLIQERKTDYLDTIPIINQIPLLRRLFGNTNASVERSEILVLITGYIVNEKSPIEDMLKRYNDAIHSLNSFDKDIDERSKPENKNRRILKTGEFWK
jgi:general secretion pathway protein D